MAEVKAASQAADICQQCAQWWIDYDGTLTLALSKLCESLTNLGSLVREINIRSEAVDACLGILRLLEELGIPRRGCGVLSACTQ
jgi:hypothetical protein